MPDIGGTKVHWCGFLTNLLKIVKRLFSVSKTNSLLWILFLNKKSTGRLRILWNAKSKSDTWY